MCLINLLSEVAGLSANNPLIIILLKLPIFGIFVKFGPILYRFDILLITTKFKFESKHYLANYVTRVIAIIYLTPHFLSTLISISS